MKLQSAFLGLSILAFSACTPPDDCEGKSDMVYIAAQTNEEPAEKLYFFWQQNCEVKFDDYNNKFRSWYYFSDGAGNAGTTAVDAFEIGSVNYLPTLSVSEDQPHHFDVRNTETGYNNLNSPQAYNLVNSSETDQTSLGQFNIKLNGHPAYLHIALENIDDPGGAKVWTALPDVKNVDGSDKPASNLNNWVCVTDNEYTFVKGSRFKYDPNREDNTGEICNAEKDYFTNPDDVSAVYGTYTITVENDVPFLNLIIDQGTNETYTKSFEIISSDYERIEIKYDNDGDIGIVALVPKATGAYIEPF